MRKIMKFISVINTEVHLGEAINALGHMCFGIGHLLTVIPTETHIYLGNTSQVREFRALASKKTMQHQDLLFTDFPHTMSGGDTEAQKKLTAQTAESDITYYGACFISNETDFDIEKLAKQFSVLKDYSPYNNNNCTILSDRKAPFNDDNKKKISMLINSKIPLTETLNAIAISSLRVGQLVPYSNLCLVDLVDKNGNLHSNISYHPFPILKADTVSKHLSMAKMALENKNIISETLWNNDKQPLVTVVFGNQTDVDEVIIRKQTRMYNGVLQEDQIISATNLVDRD